MTDPVWPVKESAPPLWQHQKAALARSHVHAAYAFQFEPGLGKTSTVIAEAGRMFLDGEIDTLVVVAPNRVHEQWVVKAFPDWAGYPWKGFAWPKGGLSSKKRQDAFEATMRLLETKPALRVFTFNYENVRQPAGARGKPAPRAATLKLIDRIFATSRKGVYMVYDESHRIKDHTAQQTRAALTFGRGTAKVRRVLTGTPILQGAQDLWSQYAFLDRAIIGEDNFFSFRSRYCKLAPVPGRPNAVRIIGAKDLDGLMRRVAPFTSRVAKEDALDMPAKLFDQFIVDMDPKQALAYAQMESLMLAGLQTGEHEGKIITASIVLVQLQKLLQIASGFIYDEAGEVHWLSDAKTEAVIAKVDELGGEHCVVWAPFIPLLDRLTEALAPFGPTRFRTLADVDVWAKKGGPLIANPASGGVGVDGMQVANRAFYAANAFHYEHRVQSIDRIHRGDQKRTCFYTDFISAGTKDAAVLAALGAKESFDRLSLDRLRKILGQPSLPLGDAA